VRIPAVLENKRTSFWIGAGLGLIAALGVVDYLAAPEADFTIFYLLPVSLLAWHGGEWLGLVASAVSALAWLVDGAASGRVYSNDLAAGWNMATRLCFFLVASWSLSALRKTLQRERDLARTDPMTGAINNRFFHDLAQMEINRLQRYQRPLTVVYIDLDNFKAVNDLFGHSTGDQVLRVVVRYARQYLRKTDLVARLGGDEFAFLLPETGQTAAQTAITKLHSILLDEMQRNGWPVTFSIGVLTCVDAPDTVEDMIKMADDLMYSVKNNWKNAIGYSIHAG
jgi:diguanylate cyclase (GGDEF)-like protein